MKSGAGGVDGPFHDQYAQCGSLAQTAQHASAVGAGTPHLRVQEHKPLSRLQYRHPHLAQAARHGLAALGVMCRVSRDE